MTISFNGISLEAISVVVMSCDPDYADCAIPAAVVGWMCFVSPKNFESPAGGMKDSSAR